MRGPRKEETEENQASHKSSTQNCPSNFDNHITYVRTKITTTHGTIKRLARVYYASESVEFVSASDANQKDHLIKFPCSRWPHEVYPPL